MYIATVDVEKIAGLRFLPHKVFVEILLCLRKVLVFSRCALENREIRESLAQRIFPRLWYIALDT